MAEVLIRREKQFSSAARFVQWKWIYSVVADGKPGVTIGNRLDSAVAWAKRYFPGRAIRKEWE